MKSHGMQVTVFSGFTLERLIAKRSPAIDYVITHIDALIDGPFIANRGSSFSEDLTAKNWRTEKRAIMQADAPT